MTTYPDAGMPSFHLPTSIDFARTIKECKERITAARYLDAQRLAELLIDESPVARLDAKNELQTARADLQARRQDYREGWCDFISNMPCGENNRLR